MKLKQTSITSKICLTLSLLSLLSLCYWHFPKVESDYSFDRFFLDQDPEKQYYEKILQTFGSDQSIILFVQDPAVFTPEKLKILQDLVFNYLADDRFSKIESIFTTPFIRKSSPSLGYPQVTENEVQSSPLFPDQIKISSSDFSNAMKSPFYARRFVNQKKTATQIEFVLRTNFPQQQYDALVTSLNSEVAFLKNNFEKHYFIGTPVYQKYTADQIHFANKIITPLMILFILLTLYIGTKSFASVMVTVFSTYFSIWISYWAMQENQIPLTMLTSMIPILLLTLGSTEITYIFCCFEKIKKRSLNKSHVIKKTFKLVLKPIILTSSTTILGFFSLYFHPLKMLKEFGLLMSIGLISIFLITLLMTFLYMLVENSKDSKDSKDSNLKQEFIYVTRNNKGSKHAKMNSINWSKMIIVALYFGSIVISLGLKADINSIDFMPEKSEERINLEHVKNEFPGIISTSLVVSFHDKDLQDTKDKQNNFQILKNIRTELTKKPWTQKVIDYSLMIDEIHTAFSVEKNNVANESQVIDELLLEQYELLLPVSVSSFRNSTKDTYLIKIFHDEFSAHQLHEHLDLFQKELTLPNFVELKVTGKSVLNFHAARTIVASQIQSLVIMVLLTFVIMFYLSGNICLSIIGVIVNTAPLMILFASMVVLGIALNVGTCLVATIILGISIDDTIHLFTDLKAKKRHDNSWYELLSNNVMEKKSALITTSVSLIIGFGLFGLMDLIPIKQFGLLGAWAIFWALIYDLFGSLIFLNIAKNWLGVIDQTEKKPADTQFSRDQHEKKEEHYEVA
jgi:predicted RND superfamily exporter protein